MTDFLIIITIIIVSRSKDVTEILELPAVRMSVL